MDFEKLYIEFQKQPIINFEPNIVYKKIPEQQRKYKPEIFQLLEQATLNKDCKKLEFALCVAACDGIDQEYKDYYEKILLETWHEKHEDIVRDIWLYLTDDRFSDALYKIATEPSVYRKYDFNMEPALRKCVTALKEINSEKSNGYIEKLLATKNPNVIYALEVYNK